MSTPVLPTWATKKRNKNASKRLTYRIKGELPHFIRKGRLADRVVQEQVILLLSRSERELGETDEFDPEYDRYVTIPAGHPIHTFTSDRSGSAFFIADVIDGKPGGKTPTDVFQLTFYVVPEKHNDPSCCTVEIRGYSSQGRARVEKIDDSELTVKLS